MPSRPRHMHAVLVGYLRAFADKSAGKKKPHIWRAAREDTICELIGVRDVSVASPGRGLSLGLGSGSDGVVVMEGLASLHVTCIANDCRFKSKELLNSSLAASQSQQQLRRVHSGFAHERKHQSTPSPNWASELYECGPVPD